MNDTLSALNIAVIARVPVLIWGAPGTGKTSAVEALACAGDLPCEVVVASVREPSDFNGLPVIRPDGTVDFAPPSWAARLASAGRGLLFLDEISTAAPAVQAALLRVVLDRTVGSLRLPDDVCVVAAANPPECAAGGWDLTPPLANRFLHIEWCTNGRDVAHGLTHGFPALALGARRVDHEVEVAHNARWASLVGGFLMARPELHLVLPRNIEAGGRAWPSPRSWSMAIRLAATATALEEDPAVVSLLIAGSVGEPAALEFMTWMTALDLPDPREVLAAPTTHALPERADQVFAVLSSVLHEVRAEPTTENVDAAWVLLGRLAESDLTDVAARAAMDLAVIRPPGGSANPAVRKFIPVLQSAGLW